MSDLRPRSRPSRAARRRRAILIAVVASAGMLAAIGAVVVFALAAPPRGSTASSPEPSTTPSVGPTRTPTPTPTPTFNTSALSIDDPASLWVVVNKRRPLNPQDYAPADLVEVPVPFANQPYLRQEASDAVVKMFAAFTAETGLAMQAQSAYRSYSTQVDVYNGWVSSLGQAGADLTSARPGHSEHQTGLAIDINALPDQGCTLEPCWGDTPHAKWLLQNSWRYGFIVRYQADKTSVTGYESEPYHMRYVSVALATEMHTTGIRTLEEFFGLPPAPDYGG